MRFFANRDINYIYLHTALQSFAYNAGGAFIYVYLVKAGIALPIVFLVIAAAVLSRIAIRQTFVPLLLRIGLRNGLVIGTLLDASSFLFLGHVKTVDAWLFGYIAFSAVGTAFYWTCYHSCITRLGDEEHRGAQVSAREAIFAMTGIAGPIFGGLMLTWGGPIYAFATAAFINSLAAVPMLKVARLPIATNIIIDKAKRNFARSITFADGIVAASVNFGWRIILFKTLGESFNAYGGALAAASVVGAVMGLGVGRLIDLGHHKRSVQIGIAIMALTVLAESFGYASVWSAVLANTLGAIAAPLYMSAIMAPYYNAGKTSGCALRYNILGESGFDLGAGLSCLLFAALTWAGFGPFWLIMIGLIGCGAAYASLRNKPVFNLEMAS